MKRVCLTVATGWLAIAGCTATHDALSVDDVTGPMRFGSADNVMGISRLYLSAQPDAQGFQAARERGVTTVINLRTQGETDFDSGAAARDAGLTYYQVPVSGAGDTFERPAFERISALVAAHPGETILLHCSSGNRAAAWLAAHLVEDHGMAPADALPIARRAGLTRDDVEARVNNYLEDSPTP